MRYFNNSYPPSIIASTADHIDYNQEFFDSLREDYEGFNEWFENIRNEQRNLFYSEEEGQITGILIWKVEENSPIDNKAERWLKICTIKMSEDGKRQGELFLKHIFEVAIDNECEFIYCTLYEKQTTLLWILGRFGFEFLKKKENEELIHGRRVKPRHHSVWEFNKKHWPFYASNQTTSYFIIPITPLYHDRFFPEHTQNVSLSNYVIHEEGKAGYGVDKAYITHSKIKKIKKGDLVIFYISQNQQLSLLGCVEKLYYNVETEREASKILHKRNIYSLNELKDEINKGQFTIIFFQVLNGAPQSIVEIGRDKFEIIKNQSQRLQYFQII